MSVQDIIRAWKDKEFRAGLSEAQRALLPDNPAGAIELSAAALEQVWGGACICAVAAVWTIPWSCFLPHLIRHKEAAKGLAGT